MRMSLIIAAALLAPAPVGAAPDFIPSAKQSFEGFVALGTPRPEVPVGALWIEGFGPTGEAAPADNLLTTRSLNGVTIDKGLQLSLTAGLFDMLGIEPRYRDHFNARFTDLAIVEVKDISRLAGQPGEPRIVSALKAASVIVTTDSDAGINARTMSWSARPIDGQSTNGRTRSYSIEGRDLFIAYRVAVSERIVSRAEPLRLEERGPNLRTADRDSYRYSLRYPDCASLARDQPCPATAVGLVRLNSRTEGEAREFVPFGSEERAELRLHSLTSERGRERICHGLKRPDHWETRFLMALSRFHPISSRSEPGGTSNGFASFSTILMVGLRSPRSMSLT